MLLVVGPGGREQMDHSVLDQTGAASLPDAYEQGPDDSPDVLAVTFSLIFRGSELRHRQVLKLIPIDHATMRYQVSLDFTIPHAPANSKDPVAPRIYVPVAIVPKRILGEVDLKDDWGRSLPAVNRDRECQLTCNFLVLFWLINYVDPLTKTPNPAATEVDLPPQVSELLLRIIELEPDAAIEHLTTFKAEWQASWKDTVRHEAQGTLYSIIELLASQAMLYAVLQEARLGTRRVVKLGVTVQSPVAALRPG
jgi:hypothetical protein